MVDSGSDFCIFPASFAKALGIALPTGKSITFTGSADRPQVAHFETIQVAIWNENREEDPISFDVYAGFCDSVEHVGLGILGQHGFFSQFKVTCDHTNEVLTIT